MTEPGFDDRRLSFGASAASYADHRPGYPRAAVAWVLEAVPRPVTEVADVGAGTGALTRTLVELGLDVKAYEPDAGMLDELAARLPEVSTALAGAEALPAADGSLDAVLVAQAWHWFDQPAAAREFRRVLRPDGVVGLLWNVRDTRTGWMAELQAIIGGEDAMRAVTAESSESSQGLQERAALEDIRAVLPDAERETFAHTSSRTPQGILDLVSTYSYVRLSPRAEQIYAAVRELLATHPDTAGRDVIEIPFVTATYRAIASGGAS